MVCSPEIMRPCPLRAVLSKYCLLPYRCTALLIRGALYFLKVVLYYVLFCTMCTADPWCPLLFRSCFVKILSPSPPAKQL